MFSPSFKTHSAYHARKQSDLVGFGIGRDSTTTYRVGSLVVSPDASTTTTTAVLLHAGRAAGTGMSSRPYAALFASRHSPQAKSLSVVPVISLIATLGPPDRQCRYRRDHTSVRGDRVGTRVTGSSTVRARFAVPGGTGYWRPPGRCHRGCRAWLGVLNARQRRNYPSDRGSLAPRIVRADGGGPSRTRDRSPRSTVPRNCGRPRVIGRRRLAGEPPPNVPN